MSDLIERLRTYSDQLGGITDEAANEIERWKAIAKALFKSKVMKMQGFSNPFTTVPTPEQSEAREIAKSEAMTLDEVSKELRDSGVDVDAFFEAMPRDYRRLLRKCIEEIGFMQASHLRR